jgi:hypothetical protein
MSETKPAINCDYCLDRGWVVEQGFSPTLEHIAECVPCPVCKPKPDPELTRQDRLLIAATIIAILTMAFLLV